MEVAAGIWGLSNKDKVHTHTHTHHWLSNRHTSFCVGFSLRPQVVEDVTEFYKQTYNNYKDTRQEALKETLRLIHFGVRSLTQQGHK